jgi:hypothetical protein
MERNNKKIAMSVFQLILSLTILLALIFIIGIVAQSTTLVGIALYLIVAFGSMGFLFLTQIIYYVARKYNKRIPGIYSYIMKHLTKEQAKKVGFVKALLYEQYLYNMDRIIYAGLFFVVFLYYIVPGITGVSAIVGEVLVGILFGIWSLSYFIFMSVNFRLMEIKYESIDTSKDGFAGAINPRDFDDFIATPFYEDIL